ncbi:MAG: SDR family oxidoreductase [Gammaproteobacteria bacterium]
MINDVFIVGCGDIGERVARLWRARGVTVSGLARSQASHARLVEKGISAVPGDLDDILSLVALPVHNTLIYYFAPPPERGGADSRIQHFLSAIPPNRPPCKIIYLSTSGVYGDHQGGWVDEDTLPNPQTPRAQARISAETAVLNWGHAHDVPVVILRVGGIYGPGRLPIERIKQGQPVVRATEAPYTNRIHADDLAQICLAAAERGADRRIYNVCDGEHSTMTDYFHAVADALGLPRPPEISLAEAQKILNPAMLSYVNESRRMDNRRMREELGVTLRYPTLQEGLVASTQTE